MPLSSSSSSLSNGTTVGRIMIPTPVRVRRNSNALISKKNRNKVLLNKDGWYDNNNNRIRYPLGRPIGDLLHNNNNNSSSSLITCDIEHEVSLYNITTTYDNKGNNPTPITNIPLHLRTDTLPCISILYKPPGYSCTSDDDHNNNNNHQAATTTAVDTTRTKSCSAIDYVKKYLNIGNINSDKRVQCGFIHRLDIFTSGIIMVAHTYAAYYQLRHQFKNRAILKKYICLVHGHMDEDSGIIDTNIQTYSSSSNSRSKHIPISSSSSYSTTINNNSSNITQQQQQQSSLRSYVVTHGGKNAITKWKLIKRYTVNVKKNKYSIAQEKVSLLEVEIPTGRTHQIRLHMYHIGHPIVSDYRYNISNRQYNEDIQWCPRLFLHAYLLAFYPPSSLIHNNKNMMNYTPNVEYNTIPMGIGSTTTTTTIVGGGGEYYEGNKALTTTCPLPVDLYTVITTKLNNRHII